MCVSRRDPRARWVRGLGRWTSRPRSEVAAACVRARAAARAGTESSAAPGADHRTLWPNLSPDAGAANLRRAPRRCSTRARGYFAACDRQRPRVLARGAVARHGRSLRHEGNRRLLVQLDVGASLTAPCDADGGTVANVTAAGVARSRRGRHQRLAGILSSVLPQWYLPSPKAPTVAVWSREIVPPVRWFVSVVMRWYMPLIARSRSDHV